MKPLLFTILCIAGILSAQQIKILSVKELNKSGEYCYPKFSPDGSKIFYTAANFTGLYFTDLATGNQTQLTDKQGAGYEYSISADGKFTAYRTNDYSNAKRISDVCLQNIETKEVIYLEKSKRDVSMPQFVKGNTAIYKVDGKLNSRSVTANSLTKTEVQTAIMVQIEDEKIAVYNNGERKILDPLTNGSYIWPSVSQDNTKLLFAEVRKGAFISDLAGNILVDLGKKCHAPKFSPDGKWVVYMRDFDNGSNYTDSEIWVVSSDGQNRIQLTDTKNVIEMYPEWSADGKNIVCAGLNGKILVYELEYSK